MLTAGRCRQICRQSTTMHEEEMRAYSKYKTLDVETRKVGRREGFTVKVAS